MSNPSAQVVGGSAARITGQHWTEESWIVTETVNDITEMSAYAIKRTRAHRLRVDSIRPGLFRLSLEGDAPLELDVSLDLWDPASYAAFAQSLVGQVKATTTQVHTPVNRALLDLNILRLTGIASELSRDLASHMENARLHESAALTIGGFALRESAGRFHDVRWALNRMTAHLALAHALSNRKLGVDGLLADAIRLTLANQQARALAAMKALDTGADSAAARPWTSALRLRITQDWRGLANPDTATRLERLEYVRARRATLPDSRAIHELERLKIDPADAPDWARIIQAGASYMSVEDGRAITEGWGVAVETAEFAEVFSRLHRRTLVIADLNARAGRGMAGKRVDILPWGAWAEFAQRHLAMLIVNVDRVKRVTLAKHETADEANRTLDGIFGSLSMVPLASTLRGRGAGEAEYDLSRLNDAVALAAESPERVTPFVWQWLERAARGGIVSQTMPAKAKWFYGPSQRMPLDAGSRWSSLGTIEGAHAVWQAAPHDYGLSTGMIRRQFGNSADSTQIASYLGLRLEYDTRAIDYAIQHTDGDTAALALRARSCAVSAAKCLDLASAFVRLDRSAEAATAYERALDSEEVDEVTAVNGSRWLVFYYHQNGRTDRALALAERSADAYSARGLTTAALLYEKLQRFDDAERMYQAVHERYDHAPSLLGFYYRMVNAQQEKRFEQAWRSTLATVFPAGLQPPPSSSTAEPARGVLIYRDTVEMAKAGVQAGDIIVAVEGYRVENLTQYDTINECFRDKDDVRLTLWRGGNFERTLQSKGRDLDFELKSHPITGF